MFLILYVDDILSIGNYVSFIDTVNVSLKFRLVEKEFTTKFKELTTTRLDL